MTQSHLQLVQRIHPHSKLLRTWRLEGGVSAQVTALEILLPNHQTKKMIIRQYGKVDLQRNHHLAADEFRLLHILNHAELPVPMPYYFNQSDNLFSTSYIVIQFIEGQTLFKPADFIATEPERTFADGDRGFFQQLLIISFGSIL